MSAHKLGCRRCAYGDLAIPPLLKYRSIPISFWISEKVTHKTQLNQMDDET